MKEYWHFTAQLSDLWPFKVPAAVALGYYLEFIGASANALITLFAFIWIDLFFGYWLALRQNTVSYERLFRWVQKVGAYFFIIALCGHTIRSLFAPLGIAFPLLDVAMAMMILTEAKSILTLMEKLELPVPLAIVWLIHALERKAKREAEKFLDEEGKDAEEREADSGDYPGGPDGGGSVQD